MRASLLLLLLAGCTPVAAGVGGAAELASVPVLGRGLPDVAVSAATGKDCSVVRLDQGKSYCRPTDPPPPRPQFCTRSLGVVDCWANPEALNGPPPHQVADGPNTLTPAQEANRTRGWP